MGDISFFYSGAVDDLVTASIDLALIYRCDPFIFLERPSAEVDALYAYTNKRLREQQRE